MIYDLYKRLKWMKKQDRLGPDMLTTHWMLHIPRLQFQLCKKKMGTYHTTSDFRAGAYAINCSNIHLGQRVVIRTGSMLIASNENGGQIIIEDDVLVAPYVSMHVSNHKFDNPNLPIIEQGYTQPKDIILKRGCWVGAHSVILSGVTIGENAVVAAGSVVNRDVLPHTLVGGVPAKVIKYLKGTNND